jgi:ATP-dependent exoDNAse (exonuclease V) alpha subunit
MGLRRTSSFEASERRHLDYGYAVTSHSSQGQTAGRVLVHVETARASEKLDSGAYFATTGTRLG